MERNNLLPVVLCSSIGVLLLVSQTIIFYQISKVQQPRGGLQFVDEDIIVLLSDANASMRVRYKFRNSQESAQFTIILPVAKEPRNITAMLNTENIEWSKSEAYLEGRFFQALVFSFFIEKFEYKNLFVNYTRDFDYFTDNNITFGRFEYIVGSTQSWSAPLEFSHFEFWWKDKNSLRLLETRDYDDFYPDYFYETIIFRIPPF